MTDRRRLLSLGLNRHTVGIRIHMIPALRALRPLPANRYCLIHRQDTISGIKERTESTPPEPQVHMNGCKLPADLKAKVAQGKASKQERIAYKYAPIECCTIEGKWCRRKGSDQRVANGYAPLACRLLYLKAKERTRDKMHVSTRRLPAVHLKAKIVIQCRA